MHLIQQFFRKQAFEKFLRSMPPEPLYRSCSTTLVSDPSAFRSAAKTDLQSMSHVSHVSATCLNVFVSVMTRNEKSFHGRQRTEDRLS